MRHYKFKYNNYTNSKCEDSIENYVLERSLEFFKFMS